MGLINHTISSLYNGISQQPETLRLDSQCKEQINIISSVVDGIYKRPPSEFIKNIKLNSLIDFDDNLLYTINRDNINYFILLSGSEVLCFDENGREIQIEYTDTAVENYVKDTINSKNNSIKLTKVEDYNVLTNTEVQVKSKESEEDLSQIFVNKNPYYTIATLQTIYGYVPGNSTEYFTFDNHQEGSGAIEVYGENGAITYPADRINQFVSQINNLPGYSCKKLSDTDFKIQKDDGGLITGLGSYQINMTYNPTVASMARDTMIIQENLGGEEIETIVNSQLDDYYFTIKQGLPEVEYTVFITFDLEGVTTMKSFTFEKVDSTSPELYRTTNISNDLKNKINSYSDDTNGVDLYAEQNSDNRGNTVKISSPSNSIISITSIDDAGDRGIFTFKDEVEKMEDLPVKFFNGKVIYVKSEGSEYGYYMLYAEEKWREWKKQGSQHALDETTMPKRVGFDYKTDYITTDNELGLYLKFENIVWKERNVGDENSAPFPSFVGSTINNSFLFKGRLGFLTSYNVVFSKANDFSNFFPTTVKEILDDNPIDINSSNQNSQELKNTAIYNNNLLLFSDYSQMVLTTNNKPLTPSNTVINPTTSYNVNNEIQPITVGPNVYFIDKNNNSSSVREYFLQDNSISNEANDITLHVPSYLPNDIFTLVGDSGSNILILKDRTNKRKLYLYNYLWSNNEKIQESWSELQFNFDIINIKILDNKLYVLFNDNGDISLEVIILDNDKEYVSYKNNFNNINFNILLDKRIEITGIDGTYNNEDVTSFKLPYEIKSINDKYTIVDKENGFDYTLLVKGTETLNNETTIHISRVVDKIVDIGFNYDMKYVFNKFNIKQANSNVKNTAGHLNLKSIKMSFENTGYFSMNIDTVGRTTRSNIFSGVRLGESIIGKIGVKNGEFKTGLIGKTENIEINISNNSYLPCKFQTASWEGYYISRSNNF